jgi:hypothetical protein
MVTSPDMRVSVLRNSRAKGLREGSPFVASPWSGINRFAEGGWR